ncbi:MAG: RibD family protein, partial [Candidatus ainarchaeum sp.]|nr:RibD family protein [Candidatus ainarchaeum sp.]
FHYSKKHLPFIALKVASSSDGFISKKCQKTNITGKAAKLFSHKLRSKYDAILVGVNTIVIDNPQLTSRIKNSRNPLKIILDPYLKIPINSRVLKDKNILIITTSNSDKEKLNYLKSKGFELLIFKNKINLNCVLKFLSKIKITSVLVEGGTKTHESFLKENLVNKIYLFKSNKELFDGVPVFSKSFLKKYYLESTQNLSKDILRVYSRKK